MKDTDSQSVSATGSDDIRQLSEALTNFADALVTKGPFQTIPTCLNHYLEEVASTGKPRVPWSLMKPLIVEKLTQVIDEFHEDAPYMDSVQPNLPEISYTAMRNEILECLESHTGIPFTIQRLCEMLVRPRDFYKRTDKYLRGIEKNLRVISTVDENGNKLYSEPSLPLSTQEPVPRPIGAIDEIDTPVMNGGSVRPPLSPASFESVPTSVQNGHTPALLNNEDSAPVVPTVSTADGDSFSRPIPNIENEPNFIGPQLPVSHPPHLTTTSDAAATADGSVVASEPVEADAAASSDNKIIEKSADSGTAASEPVHTEDKISDSMTSQSTDEIKSDTIDLPTTQSADLDDVAPETVAGHMVLESRVDESPVGETHETGAEEKLPESALEDVIKRTLMARSDAGGADTELEKRRSTESTDVLQKHEEKKTDVSETPAEASPTKSLKRRPISPPGAVDGDYSSPAKLLRMDKPNGKETDTESGEKSSTSSS